MKKFYYPLLILSLLLLQTPALHAQQQRLVLVEEFTNTGCGPCASWSPVLDSCINYRLGECIAIKYHCGFPNKEDEFYLYDQEVLQERLNYYGVTGVPATFVDGQELGNRSFGYLNDAISYSREQPVRCAVTLSKQLKNHVLTVDFAAAVRLSTTDSDVQPSPDMSNLRLFIAVIEEHIESPTPYPNGERELYYTMRKMLVPAGGLAFETLVNAGGAEWTVDFFDDESKLGVVAFVQDIETKEILGTAYSGPNAEGENCLSLTNLYDTPDLICKPDYYGKVILRNDGANTVTKATLNVEVNGTVKQYDWTGSLDYLQRDTLVFDGFTTFTLADSQNEVKVWMSDVNGTDAVSNTRTSSFSNSVQATYDALLKIYTDKKPEEITWKLYNSAGDVIREGGPYTEPRKFVTIPFELKNDDCYQIEFLDAGGDGIKGAYGNGYYQLFQVDEAGKTKRIAQGDYDGSVFDLYFNLTNTPKTESRLVLFEEFTNTSCDPCAEFSPSLDRVISDRLGDMVAITYHYNFPSPQDPFYLACSDDVAARAQYYGVNGVPALRVDGEHEGAWGYEEYLDLYVTGYGQKEPEMKIDTRASFDADGQLNVEVGLTSLTPQLSSINPADLLLFVAAVEERVEWDQPAANGERSWNYVLRKMLSGGDGIQIDLNDQFVTPQNYTFSWTPDNLTDPNELGLVVFVQEKGTGHVLNAAYTPRPTGSDNAAKILQVLNVPERICTPDFTADLRIRNTGRNTLTSANVNVSVNGQVQTTPWTGQLDYLDIAVVRTPHFRDFNLSDTDTNEVELWLSDLNGSDEETPHRTLTLANAYKAQHSVRLTVMTDQNPEEITWTVTNSAGDVVAQGGPYTEARKKQVVMLPLDADDCYLLEFEDAGGDGIAEGRGYFMLHQVDADGKARLMVQQTYSEALYDVFFSLENVSIADGVDGVTLTNQQPGQPGYDLGGRPATKGLVISNQHKTIVK